MCAKQIRVVLKHLTPVLVLRTVLTPLLFGLELVLILGISKTRQAGCSFIVILQRQPFRHSVSSLKHAYPRFFHLFLPLSHPPTGPHRKTNKHTPFHTYTHTATYGQFRVASLPHKHVFGLQYEARVSEENPTPHRKGPDPGSNPQLSCCEATAPTTAPPHQGGGYKR